MSKKNFKVAPQTNSYTVSIKTVTVMIHTLMAGPDGIIQPGTVITLSKEKAEDLLRGGHASVVDVSQEYLTIGKTEIADAPQSYETRADE